ncbi:AbrB/MazE/SpoVT family DNA-binding domain-containing protein [candidate division KSB1 bacterium]|nr:AbrB/MazE/SpoVT family DNA-binding domain-containing protein [candidate division KSB1 bacterium]
MPIVAKNGNITIQVEVRKAMNINTGDELIFEIQDEKLFIRKKNSPFQKYIGYLKITNHSNVNNIIQDLRDDSQ